MKKLNSMFYYISILTVCLFSAQLCFATETEAIIIRKDDPVPPQPTKPPVCSMAMFVSVTATINDTELAVYFTDPIGIATITVTDENAAIVYQETIDTNSIPELYIPVDTWTSGNYTLTITYDTETLIGEFQLE